MKKQLSTVQIQLRKRLLELVFVNGASHMGSSFSMIDIIESVYQEKNKNDFFILSNGHAGYALYTVLEKHDLFKLHLDKKLPIHPTRELSPHITASTGSLGQGLPIAVGIAIANPDKNVFCAISDGECQEGSIWEALRLIQDLQLKNIMILVNANGWGAYSTINIQKLQKRFKGFGYKVTKCDGHNLENLQMEIKNFTATGQPQLLFCTTIVNHFSFLKGQDAHYYVMSRTDYQSALESLGPK